MTDLTVDIKGGLRGVGSLFCGRFNFNSVRWFSRPRGILIVSNGTQWEKSLHRQDTDIQLPCKLLEGSCLRRGC